MKILKTVQKIPGGLMVVPLLIGAAINTFCPSALEIGGFTTALFKSSASALIALFCLCNAAQINFKNVGAPLVKGVGLTAAKFIIGAGIGWIIGKVFGTNGLLGITPLAFIAAVTNSNGGMYAALAGEYGDASDVGAISVLSLNDGPFFTLVALGATGLATIPYMTLVACIVPIVLGFILGNLDEDLRQFLAHGTTVLIPFFAFPHFIEQSEQAHFNSPPLISEGLGTLHAPKFRTNPTLTSRRYSKQSTGLFYRMLGNKKRPLHL